MEIQGRFLHWFEREGHKYSSDYDFQDFKVIDYCLNILKGGPLSICEKMEELYSLSKIRPLYKGVFGLVGLFLKQDKESGL